MSYIAHRSATSFGSFFRHGSCKHLSFPKLSALRIMRTHTYYSLTFHIGMSAGRYDHQNDK
ncbi:MAG: hypothetical protein ACJ72V_13290, partial [Nitrososphaeraceae archaeon]